MHTSEMLNECQPLVLTAPCPHVFLPPESSPASFHKGITSLLAPSLLGDTQRGFGQ